MGDLLLGLMKSLAVKAYERAKELEPVPERGFVVHAARQLVEAVRYYEAAVEKRRKAEVWP